MAAKRKKLVSKKRILKTYGLTAKGKLAFMLQELQELVEEVRYSSEQIIEMENTLNSEYG